MSTTRSGSKSVRKNCRSSSARASAHAKASVRGQARLQETNVPNAAANLRTVLSMTRQAKETPYAEPRGRGRLEGKLKSTPTDECNNNRTRRRRYCGKYHSNTDGLSLPACLLRPSLLPPPKSKSVMTSFIRCGPRRLIPHLHPKNATVALLSRIKNPTSHHVEKQGFSYP